MSAISLSAGQRSNLLALQATSDLLQSTQLKLATGKRINSALDNPSNFFTAQNLDNRAADLNALLDNIGQSQQAIAQANNGLMAIKRLVESAKSLAQQAKLQPDNLYWSGRIGSADVTAPAAASVTSVNSVSWFQGQFGGLQLDVGGTTYTVPPTSAVTDLNGVIDAINSATGLGPSGAVTASKDGSGRLVLTSNSSAKIVVKVYGSAQALELLNPDFTQLVPGLSGTSLSFQVDAAAPKTVTFGTGAGQVATLFDLQQALSSSGMGADLVPGQTLLRVYGFDPQNKQGTLSVSGTAAAALGITTGAQYMQVSQPSNARDALAQQYNAVMQQIDQLVGDASYNGTNLLKGDRLTLNLDETGASKMMVDGVTDDSAGLGLSQVRSGGFQTNADVDTYLDQLATALSTLHKQASAFSGNLSTVQVRQDFTNQMISTLQNGADALTLADSNAEGANLLALQTRQQLSTTALSLATQSGQSVLRLFG